MNKLLHFVLLMQICFTISAQDTLVAYKFNVTNSNAPTIANSLNTGDLLIRESAYTSSYTYPVGSGTYSLTSGGWVNAMSTSGGYYTMFSSIGKKNIVVSSMQKSSYTGPRDFKLQYRVGISGTWADVIPDTIKCSAYSFMLGRVNLASLPVICNNKPDVYLRWVVVSNKNATGGLIDTNGNSSIDNAGVFSLPDGDSAFLDINLIKANIYAGGSNFYGNNMSSPSYEYPINSGKNTIFTSALWIGGKNQDSLYLAGERYHQNGRDYYPGPIMDSVTAQTEMANWKKVWKINKSEIDYHIAHWSDPGYVMPLSISQWPVNANPDLGLNYFMAPFVDTNGNGFYDPSNGDYPKIRGDQAIYYVINDSVYQHKESNGKRLGVEVHVMAYAYNSIPSLQKTIFINYMIYNRSDRIYDSLYLGLFTDIDIGNSQDDYIGCDSALNTYYGYNGISVDGTGTGNSYGSNPPVQAVTLLNQPMSSFIAFTSDGWVGFTEPDIASQYYYSMTKLFCIDTISLGHPHPYDTTYCTPYMYCGNPCDSNYYTEAGLGIPPFDKKGVGNTGPFTFAPGQFLAFDCAYTTLDSIGDFCGQSHNNFVNDIIQVQNFFDTHFPQNGNDLALGIETNNSSPISAQFNVFPNPTHNRITFTTNLSNTKLRLDLLDINGRLIQSYESKGNKKEMDVSDFKNGVYILKISSADQNSFVKFIKM